MRGYGWTLAPEPVREPTSPPTDRPPRGTIRRPGCTPRGCLTFLVLVTTILIESIRLWVGLLRGTRDSKVMESPFVLSTLRPEEV